MQGPTYYDILGVDPQASQEEIKKAFRVKQRAVHPDVAGAGMDGFSELVNQAHEVLSDKDKREEYDKQLLLNEQEPTAPSGAHPTLTLPELTTVPSQEYRLSPVLLPWWVSLVFPSLFILIAVAIDTRLISVAPAVVVATVCGLLVKDRLLSKGPLIVIGFTLIYAATSPSGQQSPNLAAAAYGLLLAAPCYVVGLLTSTKHDYRLGAAGLKATQAKTFGEHPPAEHSNMFFNYLYHLVDKYPAARIYGRAVVDGEPMDAIVLVNDHIIGLRIFETGPGSYSVDGFGEVSGSPTRFSAAVSTHTPIGINTRINVFAGADHVSGYACNSQGALDSTAELLAQHYKPVVRRNLILKIWTWLT